jgi:hypothetical protein
MSSELFPDSALFASKQPLVDCLMSKQDLPADRNARWPYAQDVPAIESSAANTKLFCQLSRRQIALKGRLMTFHAVH